MIDKNKLGQTNYTESTNKQGNICEYISWIFWFWKQPKKQWRDVWNLIRDPSFSCSPLAPSSLGRFNCSRGYLQHPWGPCQQGTCHSLPHPHHSPGPAPVLLFPPPATLAPPGAPTVAKASPTGGGTGQGCSNFSAQRVSLSLDTKAGCALHWVGNILFSSFLIYLLLYPYIYILIYTLLYINVYEYVYIYGYTNTSKYKGNYIYSTHTCAFI